MVSFHYLPSSEERNAAFQLHRSSLLIILLWIVQFILFFLICFYFCLCVWCWPLKKKKNHHQQINLKPLATTQPAKTSTSKAKTQPTPLPKQPAPATFGGSNKKPMSLAAGLVPAAPPKRPAATTARPSTLPSKDAKPKVSGHLSTLPGKSSPLWVSDRLSLLPDSGIKLLELGEVGKGDLKIIWGPGCSHNIWRPFRPCTFPCPCLEAILHLLGFLFLSPSPSCSSRFEHLLASLPHSTPR